MDPAGVRFVLVEPRSGGNVGAAARALDNLGFSELVVVRPACDVRGEEARRMAVDAGRILEEAPVHDTLDDALRDVCTVLGTSRRVGKHRQPHYALDALAPRAVELTERGPLAVLFGREDHGLTDEILDRCTHLVYLPANARYPSFNLAQAVLLVGWELRRASARALESASTSEEEEELARQEEREAMYAHLRSALLRIGFLHSDSETPIMRRLRRLLSRAALTAEEVRMLRGIARQVDWAAGQAGLDPADEPESRS